MHLTHQPSTAVYAYDCWYCYVLAIQLLIMASHLTAFVVVVVVYVIVVIVVVVFDVVNLAHYSK